MARGYAGSKTDEAIRDYLCTPDWLFDWLDARFAFDLDLACTYASCKVIDIATRLPRGIFFDQGMNAFGYLPRRGQVIFCNPPYSKLSPWLDLFDDLRTTWQCTVVTVLPTPNSDLWQEDLFQCASELCYITGRVAFIDPTTGLPKQGNNRGTVIATFAPRVMAHPPVITRVSQRAIKAAQQQPKEQAA